MPVVLPLLPPARPHGPRQHRQAHSANPVRAHFAPPASPWRSDPGGAPRLTLTPGTPLRRAPLPGLLRQVRRARPLPPRCRGASMFTPLRYSIRCFANGLSRWVGSTRLPVISATPWPVVAGFAALLTNARHARRAPQRHPRGPCRPPCRATPGVRRCPRGFPSRADPLYPARCIPEKC